MRTIQRILVYLIALLWIWSGVLKLLSPDVFQGVIAAHGVLPTDLIGVAFRGVPLIEVCLGLGFAWYFGHRAATLRFLLVSLGLISVFTVYLAMVPAQAIREVGCGCQGGSEVSRSLSDSLGIAVRTSAMGFNATLAAIHLLLILIMKQKGEQATNCLSAQSDVSCSSV